MSFAEQAITWAWKRLDALSPRELHAILSARTAVFIVEQSCPYQDPDQWDLRAWHLSAWSDETLAAYLRVVDPGGYFAEVALGRVLTTSAFRRTGLGRALMSEALGRVAATYGNAPIRISAQRYLTRFYESFGFQAVSDSYLEDGIPHVEMLRTRRPSSQTGG